MIKLKTRLEGMTIKLGNIKIILRRIFATILEGGQVNFALSISTDNNNNTRW